MNYRLLASRKHEHEKQPGEAVSPCHDYPVVEKVAHRGPAKCAAEDDQPAENDVICLKRPCEKRIVDLVFDRRIKDHGQRIHKRERVDHELPRDVIRGARLTVQEHDLLVDVIFLGLDDHGNVGANEKHHHARQQEAAADLLGHDHVHAAEERNHGDSREHRNRAFASHFHS